MLNCTTCEFADFETGKCKRLLIRLPHVCPYAEEKEKKPMLDLDAMEVGFYAKGMDGNFYKVDLPVDFPVTKSINALTGEIHYPNNYAKMKSMSPEELANYFDEVLLKAPFCNPEKVCTDEDSCVPCILRWLKEEITDV